MKVPRFVMLAPVVLTLLLPTVLGAQEDVDRIVTAGIRSGVFPGAVVVIGTRDTVLLSKGYGGLTWQGKRSPNPDSTLYDLASLTKVVGTTAAVMRLVDRGALDLDRPVQTYLPGFVGAGKARVTVRQLLQHRSGLRAFLDLSKLTETSEAARRRVLEEPLSWPAGTRTVYSDLNGMLLGWIVETVAGEALDSVVARLVATPLGMTRTRYRPPRAIRARVAPVGRWRGQPIAGQVHDQNAARLNGVSGHAGLYSTGGDLARYARTLLAHGRTPEGAIVFQPETVAAFVRRGPGGRALGWEMRDTSSTDNTGSVLSSQAFGHTGYTGTSIWIDPVNDVFVILLTNRVYAPRTGRSITRLKQIRGQLADAAMRLRFERCGLPAMRGSGGPPC